MTYNKDTQTLALSYSHPAKFASSRNFSTLGKIFFVSENISMQAGNYFCHNNCVHVVNVVVDTDAIIITTEAVIRFFFFLENDI